MKLKLFLVFIGLVVGGCVSESIKTDPNFMVVLERSYFEGWALLTYWFFEKFIWHGEDL